MFDFLVEILGGVFGFPEAVIEAVVVEQRAVALRRLNGSVLQHDLQWDVTELALVEQSSGPLNQYFLTVPNLDKPVVLELLWTGCQGEP